MTRTIFIHWGLPRTGTTAFQRFLGENSRLLAAQGFLYPRMGWRGSPHPAHHNIAWQLIGDSRFSPTRGTIDDLLAQLQQHDGNVLLSSEDFVMTPHHPAALMRFLNQLRQLGYGLVVILVLREQRELAHSLYAEMVAHQGYRMGFSDFLSEICSTSEFRYRSWRHPFDFQAYLRLLEPFFPDIRILPFHASCPQAQSDYMASLMHVCGLEVSKLSVPQVVNRSASPWSLVRSHHRNCYGLVTRSVDAVLDEIRRLCPSIQRFTPAEAALLDETFAATNFAVQRTWRFQFNISQVGCWQARTLTSSDLFRAEFHRMLVAVADRDASSRWHRWIHARISRPGRLS